MQEKDRVQDVTSGHIGIVKEINGEYVDVNWLTFTNVPSVLTSCCLISNLKIVGENVVPMPKSAEWQRKSDEFFNQIIVACHELIGD